MNTVTMAVTPQQAEAWLKGNTLNRDLRAAAVKKYARAMAAGQWELTPDGISFSPSGRILQGQHRLHAIVKSGCTVMMRVTYNVPESAYAKLDTGVIRNLQDRTGADKREAQCAHAMITGFHGYNKAASWTTDDIDQFYRTHEMAIRFAVQAAQTSTVGLRRPQLAAVIARAFYTEDHGRLRRFASVVVEGLSALEDVVTPGDRTAILLRDIILRMRTASGGSQGMMLYRRIERALCAYLKNKELRAEIRPARSEEWPLPHDAPQT